MSPNVRLVRDFIAAWNQNDIDRVMSFFAPDCVYDNVPVGPVSGHPAIRAVIEGFAGLASEIDWRLEQIAESSSGVVLTERLDRFRMGEKWVELPVMGRFEIESGRIRVWRDYFDLAQFQKQLPGAA